jgi:hypothetical protein
MRHAATFLNEYLMKHKGKLFVEILSYVHCDLIRTKKSDAAINKHQCSEKCINGKKYFKIYLGQILVGNTPEFPGSNLGPGTGYPG